MVHRQESKILKMGIFPELQINIMVNTKTRERKTSVAKVLLEISGHLLASLVIQRRW